VSRRFLVVALVAVACGAQVQSPSPECAACLRCYEATGGSRVDSDYTES
jgi:hypothetical protein